ncbi:MAG: V-type ATP synthase subunit D [Candidatus Omnitrophica bacterium]|nr:V-type ATP synthase subunit D [Candidatus Omnitrophota bacterium]
MAKLKLTKNEQKKQKDSLKRFRRYLPVLILKKQQLQLEILKTHSLIDKINKEIEKLRGRIDRWVAVFGEDVGFKDLVGIKEIITKEGNIAGVDIPLFERVEFDIKEYDLMKTPLWVDYGIDAAKKIITLKARREVLEKQLVLIREELRTTAQRVNLFEKVKIPEARENIRKIGIWLGDQQTVAVVTGKIAKMKIQRKEGMLV